MTTASRRVDNRGSEGLRKEDRDKSNIDSKMTREIQHLQHPVRPLSWWGVRRRKSRWNPCWSWGRTTRGGGRSCPAALVGGCRAQWGRGRSPPSLPPPPGASLSWDGGEGMRQRNDMRGEEDTWNNKKIKALFSLIFLCHHLIVENGCERNVSKCYTGHDIKDKMKKCTGNCATILFVLLSFTRHITVLQWWGVSKTCKEMLWEKWELAQETKTLSSPSFPPPPDASLPWNCEEEVRERKVMNVKNCY